MSAGRLGSYGNAHNRTIDEFKQYSAEQFEQYDRGELSMYSTVHDVVRWTERVPELYDVTVSDVSPFLDRHGDRSVCAICIALPLLVRLDTECTILHKAALLTYLPVEVVDMIVGLVIADLPLHKMRRKMINEANRRAD